MILVILRKARTFLRLLADDPGEAIALFRAKLARIVAGPPRVARPPESVEALVANYQAGGPGPDLDERARRQRYRERRGCILVDLISAVLPPEERFVVLDGGAREAMGDPRWQVLPKNKLRIYGFEPDAAEVEKLNVAARDAGYDFRYFAGALWRAPCELTFYENKSPGGGSFYPQNTDLTDRWKFENSTQLFHSRDIFHPTGTTTWKMTSLDVWRSTLDHAVDIDFMKLNVQGAELEILKGAETFLDGTLGLMVEISFVESYKDRPFFSDIDAYLRAENFAFFDMIGDHCMGRSASPITAQHLPGLNGLYGQLIEAHGIYFRDPIDMAKRGKSLDGYSIPKLLKLAAFADAFGQIEYAFELLGWIETTAKSRGETQWAKTVADVATRARDAYLRYMA
jgi:FkbM family methyltransferase